MAGDPNEVIQCRRGDIDRMLSQQRAEVVKDILSPVRSKQQTGYFSTVRFAFKRTSVVPGVGPFTYTAAAETTRVAFSYKTDDANMESAGFEAGAFGKAASLRYTNLSQAGQTRDGETYYVKGIAFYLGATSDSELAKRVWDAASCKLVMNTDSIWALGSLIFFPATSGLSGRGFSRIVPPNLSSEIGETQLLQNSVEDANAYFAFDEPLIWTPSGNVDASLAMEFNLKSNLVVSGVTARAAAAGVAPYDPPADGEVGTYVDITVRLVGHSIRRLSVNK